MKKTIMFFISLIFLISCSSFIYYPNSANAPLLREKEDMKFSVGIKGMGVDIQSAYALNEKIGIQVNANIMSVENTETVFNVSTEYRNGNYYGETAIGYFNELIPKLVFETYLGAGIGQSFSKNLNIDQLRTSMYSKIYLQQDLGYRSKILNAGIVFREAFVNAYQTKIDNVDQNVSAFDFFFEPSLFLAVGVDRFKVNAQAGLSYSSGASITNYAPFIFYLGIETFFRADKKTTEK